MAGRKELPKISATSLRELAAKTTLRNVRLQGHTYVDLREDGNKFIYFCTICLAPCYNDNTLFSHLEGNLHAQRYAAAKVTLLGPNPFPFSDGVLFFHDSSEPAKQLAILGSNQNRFLKTNNNMRELTVVSHSIKTSNTVYDVYEELEGNSRNKNLGSRECVLSGHVNTLNANGRKNYIVVPNVVCNDQLSDLAVRFIGFGEIAARICENDDGPNRSIDTIWCAWLGEGHTGDENLVPDHDFGIVTFSYNYTIGRAGLSDDLHPMLTSGAYSENENADNSKKKRKKSFSDPEDISESLGEKRVSHGEDRNGERIQNEKIMLSKSARRALRRQQRIDANSRCDVCQQKILPGKDVSALLNMQTGQLACSSRNSNGAFHVFHTSCLIHWILLCEFEIWTNQFEYPKMIAAGQEITNGSQTNGGAKQIETLNIAPKTPISSVFCTECQGHGIYVEERLENPSVFLSEMFKYKLKLSDAHRAWMKGPEVLQNCSTGLRFSGQSNEAVQGYVKPLKILHFYRADE